MPAPELPVIAFADQAAWAEWLDREHERAPGVWIKFAKKGTGVATVTYAEALEEALRRGWIDGQAKGIDDDWYLQRFTPRTKRSKWSRINRESAIRLIDEGRMLPAGLRQVELARADGRWEAAYEPPSTSKVPDDLQSELDRFPEAAEFFATLDSQNRYAVLHRIGDAKRPETRARRIAKFVEMLRAGEKIYP
jgi:uncharacterized protein YdeI (YjbR/CyaY-like superfamily)